MIIVVKYFRLQFAGLKRSISGQLRHYLLRRLLSKKQECTWLVLRQQVWI